MAYLPLILPVFAMVALTFVVMLRMYTQRVAEFRAKGIHPDEVKTRQRFRERLTDSANSADNYSNLLELPVLFYAAMLIALALLVTDPVLVALAWLYVASRAVHSYIHVTYNKVMHRFQAFAVSSVILLLIWVRLGMLVLA